MALARKKQAAADEETVASELETGGDPGEAVACSCVPASAVHEAGAIEAAPRDDASAHVARGQVGVPVTRALKTCH